MEYPDTIASPLFVDIALCILFPYNHLPGGYLHHVRHFAIGG
ncbi:MAG: hypothetical protein ACI4UK_00960 [Floccifex sp.]